MHFVVQRRFEQAERRFLHGNDRPADTSGGSTLRKPPEGDAQADFFVPMLYDVAIAFNDWTRLEDGSICPERASAFLAGYQSVRVLTADEKKAWPVMLRAAALRFWISRLWDYYLPREASMLKPHDPTHFERVLRDRVQSPLTVAE